MKRIPTQTVKGRTKLLTDYFLSYSPYQHRLGKVYKYVWLLISIYIPIYIILSYIITTHSYLSFLGIACSYVRDGMVLRTVRSYLRYHRNVFFISKKKIIFSSTVLSMNYYPVSMYGRYVGTVRYRPTYSSQNFCIRNICSRPITLLSIPIVLGFIVGRYLP